MLTCNGFNKELKIIEQVTKDQAAYLTEDKWDMFFFSSIIEVYKLMEEKQLLDVICFDVSLEGGIVALESLRQENPKAYIIIIAGTEISPVLYMKPEIMAAALLLRPLQREHIAERIETMIHIFQQEKKDDELFILEDKEGRIRIPFSNIIFFESRDKKIYVCTEKEEYGFYDTLENLSGQLPEQFRRCHRGFIVNMSLVKKVVYSENTIYLLNGMIVPLSRSYKSVVREYLK